MCVCVCVCVCVRERERERECVNVALLFFFFLSDCLLQQKKPLCIFLSCLCARFVSDCNIISPLLLFLSLSLSLYIFLALLRFTASTRVGDCTHAAVRWLPCGSSSNGTAKPGTYVDTITCIVTTATATAISSSTSASALQQTPQHHYQQRQPHQPQRQLLLVFSMCID